MEEDNAGNIRILNLHGLGLIFGGFIFILLDFRVGGFDLIPNFIGYLLIFSGLKDLAEYDTYFEMARPFAAVSAAFGLFDIYQVNIKDAPNWFIYSSLISGTVLLIIHLLLYYYIIFGIRRLAAGLDVKELDRKGESVWKAQLFAGLLIYPASNLLALSNMAVLAIVCMIPSFIIQIYFLWYIKTTQRQLDGQPFKEGGDMGMQSHSKLLAASRKLFSNYACIVISALIFGVIACGVLYSRSWFRVPTSLPAEETVSDEVATVRVNMIKAGFIDDDVADMPNEEVLRYQNLKSVTVKTDTLDSDGGQCRITTYYSLLEDEHGLYRFAMTYRWMKQPRHGYGDIIGMQYNQKIFCTPTDDRFYSYNLFEKQDKQGESTLYQAKDIYAQSGCSTVYKRYRVYGDSDIVNQRGYLAADELVSSYTKEQYFNSAYFYIHQKSFLTLNEDPVKKLNGGLSNTKDFDFQYYYSFGSVEYQP